jgi:hypothetical protein
LAPCNDWGDQQRWRDRRWKQQEDSVRHGHDVMNVVHSIVQWIPMYEVLNNCGG